MKAKLFLMSAVLLIPALLLPLASCDDSKVPTEPAVDQPADPGPDFFTAGGEGHLHDSRSQAGQQLRTWVLDPQCKNTVKRFKTKDGAEVNTTGDCHVGGVYPASNKIAGKKVGSVKELDFSFSGSGNDARLQLPIDEDDDGDADGTLVITAFNGNCTDDGDGFVGTVEADDNEHCGFYYDTAYDSWHAFTAAHPDFEIAKEAEKEEGPSVWVQGGHVIIWKLDIR